MIKKLFSVLLSALAVCTLVSGDVLALSPEQRKVIDSGSLYFNVEDTVFEPCGSVNNPVSIENVYVLGDSITLQSTNEIRASLTAPPYNFTVTGINADGGRAITYDSNPTGGVSAPTGLEAVVNDSALIAGSDAVVIALGTNSGTEDLAIQIPALIQTVRDTGFNKAIFWVNLFYAGSSAGERNATIESLATTEGYTVFDAESAGIELQSDNVHPTAAGQQQFADVIVNGIRNATESQSPGGGEINLPGVEVFPIVGGGSTDGNPTHILSYLEGLDEQAAASAINAYIQEGWPESPFVGLGSAFVAGGKLYNVNPFLAVGHLQHENNFALASSGWHTTTPPSHNAFGRSASASQPHTIYTTSSGRERRVYQWSSWQASLDGNNGTEDPWFALINRRYLAIPAPDTASSNSFGIASGDFETYLSHYAPQGDGNDEAAYIAGLKETIDEIVTLMGTGVGFVSDDGGCGTGQGVNTEGYAFPLAPQTQSGVSNIGVGWSGLVRPGGNPDVINDRIHHDLTHAYDLISNDSDAAVYSIHAGVAVNVNTNFNGVVGCGSIQLLADDGYYYWYGHLKNVEVVQDQRVAANVKLAEVADGSFPEECIGSAPHLHIDRGCVIEIDGVRTPQPGGDDDCRDPEFIPLLSQMYGELPE